MTFADVFAMALANLGRRKGRTALTVAGVVIGVGALVLMVSLGLGLQQAVRVVFESEKTLRSVFITRPVTGGKKSKRSFTGFSPFGGQTIPMSPKDLDELRKVEGVEFVIPGLNLVADADFPEIPDSFTPMVLVGVSVDGEEGWLRSALKAGRIWDSRDERAVLIPTRFLAGKFDLKVEQVLGRKIVFLRGGDDAEKPRAEEVTYTVVGIVETDKLGLRAAGLIVPAGPGEKLREALKGGYLPGKPGAYTSAWVTSRTSEGLAAVKKRLQSLGYDVVTTADILEIVNTLFLVINGFFAAVGAIGLLVALLGIANTMAMAVLERTREIGIMKAVGARNADIRRVYLMEAAGIGVIGGLIGLGGGVALGSLLNAAAHGMFQQIPEEVTLFRVPILLAAGALLFATLVSMIAGFLPALRASRLDPVRSLRYE